MAQLPAFIAGQRVETEAEVAVEDPSTGGVMAVTADCGPAEIDLAVRAAAGRVYACGYERRIRGPLRTRSAVWSEALVSDPL